ncbi:hypothetical protein [Paraburkholderia humisilvae]|uniref:Uncharacterized protein n=1 Tax=Paraburkholderia humisilvae TaxID=627669 RepID=A0A6J5F870_9BURK|nr:hypothetical protein [Paraburkholderia humisilvae]CAB3774573.1 hypothetical protein LMG29542_07951 [Paraburkholderia humisilvae]
MNSNRTDSNRVSQYPTSDRESAIPAADMAPRFSMSSRSRNCALDPLNSTPSSSTEQAGESAQAVARRTYKEAVRYHGTDRESKEDILRNGFMIERKRLGYTGDAVKKGRFQADGELATENAGHHHFASNKSVAKVVAMTTSRGKEALVRVICPPDKVPLEADPFMRSANSERTRNNIDARFVLGHKQSSPNANGAVFNDLLKKAGVEVDNNRAGQLLAGVQSDSEDDFKTASGSESESDSVGSKSPVADQPSFGRSFRFGSAS